MFQTKEQNKTPGEELSKVELSNQAYQTAYQTTHSNQLATSEELTQPTYRTHLEHIALKTREECAPGTHRTSPTKGHFFQGGEM